MGADSLAISLGLKELSISLRHLFGVSVMKSNWTRCISALCDEMDWDTTVTLAENVTLECLYPLKGIVTQVEWAKIGTTKKESMAILSPVYGLVVRKPYSDRIYFLNSTMSVNDLTLSFRNASEADLGFYSCSIDAFPLGHWKKVVQVVPSGKRNLY